MLIVPGPNSDVGVALANRLGLALTKREGHDLAGPCIACSSSDAFRLHMHSGVAQCYSCGGKWSPFQLAETVTGDREQSKSLLVEIGLFKPGPESNGQVVPADPIEVIARQKGVTADSLRAFGAKFISPTTIHLPCYGSDGNPCTRFSISTKTGTQASKGLFAKGKPAGLFFPHVDGQVRLPQPDEVWHLVEGVKDAASLQGLGLLPCGMNTCRLAAKFVRLFTGVEVVMVPDRDRAGEEGSQFSARVLRGAAKSVRIAVLPAEFKESDGADVRDVLRQQNGEQLVRQAIEDAAPFDIDKVSGGDSHEFVTGKIDLSEGEPITLTVSPCRNKPQRRIEAHRGDVSHRDRINTDSSISRDRFIKKVATKFSVKMEIIGPLVEPKMMELADQVDKQFPHPACSEDEQESQATIAANMGAEWDLWHTPSRGAYATVPVDDHLETWPVKSQTFKRYVAKQFFDEHRKAINSEALSAAINLMEATALFDGEEKDVHVRLAEHEGNIYLDLCDPDWQVIEITSSGWQVIGEPPVAFRRSRGMLALPTPTAGGSVNELRRFLNVADQAWHLIVAWLLAALRPRGPYPVLALFAEQGSGKSTAGRLLRALIDPNSAPLRAEHRDARDLMIGANNCWCLAYDNISYVPSWLSDALCRLSTGGGFATRELYSDLDEAIFDSQRPVLLTSIEDVATRSDLLDRCLIVWLPAIPEDQRRREEEIERGFEKVRPLILGALLDAVAGALRDLPGTHLPTLPRMADFALWVTAAEKSLGWPTGTFVNAYLGNRDSVNDLAMESSPVGPPLMEILQEQEEWSGSATELLDAIEKRVSDATKRLKGWPKNGRSMVGHLKRLAPNFRMKGWDVDFQRESSRRTWTIRPKTQTSSAAMTQATMSTVGETMQGDAKPCNSFVDDADDGCDASLPPLKVGVEQNGNDWEEGDL